MKIWIDLANSPHVGFFLPLIRQLKKDNHEIFITLRDFSQTVELARLNNIEGTIIGTHGGKSILGKIFNMIDRSLKLRTFSQGKAIDVAVSHNSYTHIVGSWLSRIRAVTLMDYEGQPANHIAFRFADKVIVPVSFPDDALKKFGITENKVYKYEGYKEQVYLSDFSPDPLFYDKLKAACGLRQDWDPLKTVLVIVRTPATMAAYHRFGNPLFLSLLEQLDKRKDLTVIVLPRTKIESEHMKKQYVSLVFPKHSLDGNNLVSCADLVISAGGTMNREAAILGTPAYTIFAGKIPSVDTSLIKLKKMTALLNENDLKNIRYLKKVPNATMQNKQLCSELIREILN